MFGMQMGRMGRVGGRLSDAQKILALFKNGEQGAWYDPSDMSTLFQDSAGTTPVTAVGQPVGLLLDKSKGLVLGPELVTNGTFDNGISGWIQSAGPAGAVSWDETSTSLAVRDTGGLDGAAYTVIPTVAGRSYEAVFTILSVGGQCQFWAGTGGGATALQYNITYGAIVTPTTFKVVFRASHTNGSISFMAAANDVTVLVTNVSVRELPGNHATQATATARPVLQQDGNGKYYLDFDGIDDSLVTGSINFTATDKMSVFAGVYFSDATGFDGVLELVGSATPGSLWVYGNAGALEVKTRGSGGISNGMFAALSGASQSVYSVSFNLAGAAFSYCVDLRKNGTTVTNVGSGTAGGGNYGTGPITVGLAAGVRLTGRLYSLIIRGAQSSLSQIEATELYMKKKVGIA